MAADEKFETVGDKFVRGHFCVLMVTFQLDKQGHVNFKTLWSYAEGNKGQIAFIPEVVIAYIKDQVGATSEITNKLANANININ